MNLQITTDQLSSSDRRDTPVSSRRTSSRIKTNKVSSPRHQSGVRRDISKASISHASRRSSKGTRKSNRKSKENDIDLETEMDFDDNDNENDSVHNLTSSENHDNQDENQLNISSASADTNFIGNFNKKKKLEKRPIEYFTPVNNEKVKCSLCAREYKHDPFSDSNLRSHLGFKHKLYCYLFPSQIKQHERHEKKVIIPSNLKKELDASAINCIIQDGLPFGAFRRAGMQGFLNTIKPGYRGPSRQTVRRRLDKMYHERRSALKEKFKKTPFISLTTDLWMNSRRYHFLAITAHYYDEHYHQLSDIISFRCFRGRHLGARLKKFILNEIKKLEIESKIFSITTDNGSDIKSATSSYEFGIRFSCDAHSLNRTVSCGLCLWKRSTSKSTQDPTTTTTTTTNERTDDNDDSEDALEESRLVDYDVLSDEWIDCEDGDPDLDDDDDDDDCYELILIDDDENGNHSDSGSDYDDNSTSSNSQQDRRLQEEEEEQELEKLLSDPEELKSKISSLLKKNRHLIKMIHKSSILTTFVRNEIQRKQIALDAEKLANNEEKVIIHEPVNDFHIRWNSTYLMLVRLIPLQQVINDLTYSPNAHIGLTAKQVKKLRSLTNNHVEWQLLKSLTDVLAPFYLGTKCLSGVKYSTISLSYYITRNLFDFLTDQTLDSPLEIGLKNLLMNKFNLYFKTKVTNEQRCAKLIAAYLDPYTLQELSFEETNEAELLIMGLAKGSSNAKKTPSTTTSALERTQQQSAASLSSSINSLKQLKLSTLNQFRISCRSSSMDAATTSKPEAKTQALTLKQEFSVYVSTSKSLKDFQPYWDEKQAVLPILSTYARRYNCIPTTSVASESAFSVAGYIDRKQRASLSTTTLRYLMLLKH